MTDLNNLYYKLEDGRIWSTAKAAFVTNIPKDAEVIPSPVDEQGNHSLRGLQDALVFYDLPRGELVTPADVRAERDKRLAATDKYVLPDFPITEDKLAVVKLYRQALRDVPAQSSFPSSVNWPTNPMED